ncbi:hypothetical protein LCGC14_1933550, partial [marine sediment metagenome]
MTATKTMTEEEMFADGEAANDTDPFEIPNFDLMKVVDLK